MGGAPPHKKVKRILAPTGDDTIAVEEFEVFSDKNSREKESKRKAHQRGESIKDILHICAQFALTIVAGLLIIGVIIWAWHILTPLYLQWLTMDQINEIQKIMSGALLAIVVSDYAKKYFN